MQSYKKVIPEFDKRILCATIVDFIDETNRRWEPARTPGRITHSGLAIDESEYSSLFHDPLPNYLDIRHGVVVLRDQRWWHRFFDDWIKRVRVLAVLRIMLSDADGGIEVELQSNSGELLENFLLAIKKRIEIEQARPRDAIHDPPRATYTMSPFEADIIGTDNLISQSPSGRVVRIPEQTGTPVPVDLEPTGRGGGHSNADWRKIFEPIKQMGFVLPNYREISVKMNCSHTYVSRKWNEFMRGEL